MDFGKVPDHEVKAVDFTLPPDGEQTKKVLNKHERAENPQFFVGCAKWGRKEWLNMIYPPKTKEANFLDEYVRHFNAIEFNALFYGVPTSDQVRKWRDKAAAHARGTFLFCPKFSRPISHLKRLNGAEAVTDQYLASIHEFGEFLGPAFLQMSDNFGPKNMQVLESYVKCLPADLRLFVEVRHAAWFSDQAARKELFEMLSRYGKGAIITDASGRRDCVHMEVTIPEIFIRFVGNGEKHQASDFSRVDAWIERIASWMDRGLSDIYFFLHQHDEKDTPILADYTIRQFNKHLGAKIPTIKFIGGDGDITNQGELF